MPRGTHKHLVKEALPAIRPRLRQLRNPFWWILALFLSVTGYYAWREYDYQQAISEAKEAGFEWKSSDPFSLIWQDWHAAFRKETWATHERILDLRSNPNAILREHGDYDEPGCEFKLSKDLIHRLRPSHLTIASCENLDALKGYSGLRSLTVYNCDDVDALKGFTELQELALMRTRVPSEDILKSLTGLKQLSLYICGIEDADRLKSLTNLRELYIERCRFLKNLTGLRNLTKLQVFSLSHDSMDNIDALKGLTALRELDLERCVSIPEPALRELRSALPNTNITFPDGSKNPPK
jgi:Leucine-rich repeat (LRR) protein